MKNKEFSSPSGDGLVHWYENIIDFKVGFRPRLGMGWFNAVMAVWGDNPTFSSPSGDGLVLEWYDRNKVVCEFSSPSGDGLVLGNTV